MQIFTTNVCTLFQKECEFGEFAKWEFGDLEFGRLLTELPEFANAVFLNDRSSRTLDFFRSTRNISNFYDHVHMYE